jgi:hypothetical protein
MSDIAKKTGVARGLTIITVNLSSTVSFSKDTHIPHNDQFNPDRKNGFTN